MHFLDLPDDILIEILQLIDGPQPRKFFALSNIRRTCKHLVPLVEPLMFAELQVLISISHLPAILLLAGSYGRHVRILRLDLRLDLKEIGYPSDERLHDFDTELALLVSQLPAVRDLEILVPCDGGILLPNLTYALGEFREVRHFRLMEENSRTRESAAGAVFGLSDGLIRTLIKSSGSNLISFVFDGHSLASAAAFQAVCDQTPRLRTFLVRSWIGPQCSKLLDDALPWACRDSLRALSLQNCTAVTGDVVARGLSVKLWATNLRIFELVQCGVHGAPPVAQSQPVSFNIPTLQRLTLEHPLAWELDILAKLPARVATLTLIPRENVKQIVQDGLIPGMEKLTVAKLSEDDPRDDSAIDDACRRRGVELFKDPKWIGSCYCGFTE
ncbi:hypothetical protein FRC17_000087 [Serendipita sp. 399]|nr:hypothetical protein FRC17_000087 [Serendipita sp. 399]